MTPVDYLLIACGLFVVGDAVRAAAVTVYGKRIISCLLLLVFAPLLAVTWIPWRKS